MRAPGADTERGEEMAKPESRERAARRRTARALRDLRARPELVELRRQHERRRRELLCALQGAELGGRPPAELRCTKRLGTRLCWGWRAPGSDRCRLHPRA